MTAISLRTKLWICAGVAALVLFGISLTCAYRRGVADQAAHEATAQIKEAKDEANKAVEQGDGAYLHRDTLRRARKPLPR